MSLFRPLALGAGLLLAAPVLAQDAPPRGPPADVPAAASDATADLTATLPLDEEIRAASVAALQATLYDLIALREASHQEHWNLVGIEYFQFHEFYQELYTEVDVQVDVVAERILTLGVPADGRPSAVAASAVTAEPAPTFSDDAATLDFLLAQWAIESDVLYDRLDAVEKGLSTQDTLIDVSRLIDHQLWQIRAHLQASAE